MNEIQIFKMMTSQVDSNRDAEQAVDLQELSLQELETVSGGPTIANLGD